MSQRRLPVGLLMIVPVVLGFGLYAFTVQGETVPPATPTATSSDAVNSGQPTPTGTVEAGATASPPDAKPTAETIVKLPPVASHGVFHDGAWVRVNVGAGDCLNARNRPALKDDWVIVNICVPDGFEGLLVGEGAQVDGHVWWNMAGTGYVAEDYLVYVRDFDPRTNVVPALSGAADKVAFLRGADIWSMNADGSGQRLLVDNVDSDPQQGTYVQPPQGLRWSPDGKRISYNMARLELVDSTVDLHVLTIGDAAVTDEVFSGVSGGGWSPDGRRIGIIREARPAQMSSGPEGVPAILDLRDGSQLVLGSERFWGQEPQFNFDGSLLLVNESRVVDGVYHSALVFYDTSGIEKDRIDFAGNDGYASPAWSPTANRLAMHMVKDGRARYTVYDVASHRFVAEMEPPKTSDRVGGGCGGGDMWRTAWSRDGARVLYTFTFGDTGANGVWVWDVARATQTVIPAANASSATAGRGTAVMFSTWEYPVAHIFYGSAADGFARIITDGFDPVWFVPR